MPARTRGLEGAVEFFKLERNSFLQDLACIGVEKEEVFALNRIAQKYGEPFKEKVQKIRSGSTDSINCVRFALTALSSLRFLRGSGDPDFGPLTSPFSGLGWDREFVKRSASEFWKDLRVHPKTIRKEVRWSKFHVPHGAGPNGPGALWLAPKDLVTLLGEYPGTMEAVRRVGGVRLSETIDTLIGVLPRLEGTVPCDSGIGARVSAIPDKGSKVRVIAIGSYWVQTALKPLHDAVFKILKRIPQDVTHDQGGFRRQVQGWKGVNTLSSLDLSNATDRFPIDFIGDLFEPLLGKDFVDDWKILLTGIPFTYKSKDGTSREVSFAVGTPLGFYGSWGPFAMAVHFMQYLVSGNLSGQYCVLGDDYLAGDEDLAKGYEWWLSRVGVKVSKDKTFKAPRLCEFAKRLLFRCDDGNYVEVSPFPLSSIWNTEASAPLLVATLHGEQKKDLLPRSGIPGAIKDLDERLFSFYGTSFGITNKRARIRARAARHADAVMGLVVGSRTAGDCVTTILGDLRTNVQPDEDRDLSLIRSACALLYQRSLGAAARGGKAEAFVPALLKLIAAPFDCATPTSRPPILTPRDLGSPCFLAGIEVWHSTIPALRKEVWSVPVLAIYNRLEFGMIRDLGILGLGTGPLEGWPEFVRAVQLGVTGLDPRMPEEQKRVVACSLLAKAVVDLYRGKVPDPPETDGPGFDPRRFLLDSPIPTPFSELKLYYPRERPVVEGEGPETTY